MNRARLAVPLLVLLALCLTGCKTAYYGTWSKLGWEKRDLLVDAVKEARDEQNQTKEQFRDALEKFQSVVAVEGGDLQKKYDALRDEYDDSDARAKAVTARIDEVEEVAKDLFAEWRRELKEYKDPGLRRSSERLLRDTERRYDGLIDAMHRAESRMEPVLTALGDHVRYLKHNLNARAIASLQGTTAEIEGDVSRLIKEMEDAIREADQFIKEMDTGGPPSE
jgi:ElaB/YqjD/DUF883 family membrane-anchored ribosome-binding protein